MKVLLLAMATAAGLATTLALDVIPDDLRSRWKDSRGDDEINGEPLTESEAVVPEPAEKQVATGLPNRKWEPPNYAGQDLALGWSREAFKAPAGMEERVRFWKDIYTKYNSDQGVLHDSRYVHLIYETVDFSDIKAQEKLRRKRVDERKKQIAERLKRLESLSNGDGLEGEDLRYWQMFAKVDEPKKFIEASRKGRLRFQLGQRDQFINGIFQSGRYLRQMEEIFKVEGLPIEITRLPFVESSFNLRARSRVGASGIWQFMRSTGRIYMRIDSSADDRNEPLLATRAAARKMRDNFGQLKTWPLAITAYNHGPSGVRRLTEKMGTSDIVELIDVRKGRFGFASANFYASFLAALEVEKEADKYFGRLEIMPELKGTEISLSKDMRREDLLKLFCDNLDVAKLYNPHVSESVWKGRLSLQRKHTIRVPGDDSASQCPPSSEHGA